eukprot:227179-Chlamydomonas_euryale.AAC.1
MQAGLPCEVWRQLGTHRAWHWKTSRRSRLTAKVACSGSSKRCCAPSRQQTTMSESDSSWTQLDRSRRQSVTACAFLRCAMSARASAVCSPWQKRATPTNIFERLQNLSSKFIKWRPASSALTTQRGSQVSRLWVSCTTRAWRTSSRPSMHTLRMAAQS